METTSSKICPLAPPDSANRRMPCDAKCKLWKNNLCVIERIKLDLVDLVKTISASFHPTGSSSNYEL